MMINVLLIYLPANPIYWKNCFHLKSTSSSLTLLYGKSIVMATHSIYEPVCNYLFANVVPCLIVCTYLWVRVFESVVHNDRSYLDFLCKHVAIVVTVIT